jgi:hypothetical protein
MILFMMLSNLEQAMSLASPSGNGLCFHWSAALCLDIPGSIMVIGILKPLGEREIAAGLALPDDASNVPFYHAWVEYKGQVLAPTLIEAMGGLRPINKTWYYNINGCHNMRRISRRDLLQLIKSNNELKDEILFGAENGKLVDNLMKLAKLPYKLSDRRGVIP